LGTYIPNDEVVTFSEQIAANNDQFSSKSAQTLLARPHKGKSVNLSAVNLPILLDFQAPELTCQQINRFCLFVSPQELSICQSLDLISTISENNSGISIFGFCTIFWERDSEKLSMSHSFLAI
jgi:hypothetical protein